MLNRYLTILNQAPTDEISKLLRSSRLPSRSRRRSVQRLVPALLVALIVALSGLLLWPRGKEDVGAAGSGGPEAGVSQEQIHSDVPQEITVGRSSKADAASIPFGLQIASNCSISTGPPQKGPQAYGV